MNKLLWVACAVFPLAAFAQQPPAGPAAPPSSANESVTAPQDKPHHVGDGVTPPQVIHNADPEYSEEARKEKFSGAVDVYLIVDENGKPQDVRVAKSAGHGLDEEAVKAVKKYRFKPAMKDGKPVKVDMYIRVTFNIHGPR